MILTGAEVAGGVAGALVALLSLVGMLWRLMSAVVRHVEATKANTAAIGQLADAMTEHITTTNGRLTVVETTTARHEAILNGRFPAHA